MTALLFEMIFPCVRDSVWKKRLSLHECFLSLQSALLNVFLLSDAIEKYGGFGGGRGRMVEYLQDLRKDVSFHPASFCWILFFFFVFFKYPFVYRSHLTFRNVLVSVVVVGGGFFFFFSLPLCVPCSFWTMWEESI